jgi:protein-S-isoprenylcysteine O-methyltransferase Ste14
MLRAPCAHAGLVSIAAQQAERLLRTRFGAAYGAYCARTSRLIPRLY